MAKHTYVMQLVEVTCPQCENPCGVHVEERELREGVMIGGFEAKCKHCGCDFCFSVCLGVHGKVIV